MIRSLLWLRTLCLLLALGLWACGVSLDSIAVSAKSAPVPKGATTQLSATGKNSDGTTSDLTAKVTWTVSDPSLATVSSAGLLTALARGTVTVTATQAETSGTLMIDLADAALVSLALGQAPAIAKGTTTQLGATGTFTDKTTADVTGQCQFSSSATDIATVDGKGLVTAVKQGSATVTATITTPAGPISGTVMVTVKDAVLTALQINPPTPALAPGTSIQLSAAGIFSDLSTQDLTGQVTWTSENMAATVSNAGGRGALTGVAAGTARVTAAFAGKTAAVSVVVSNAVLTQLVVTPPVPVWPRGLTRGLRATGVFSDNTTQDLTGDVTWSSDNGGVATVSNAPGQGGTVTAVAIGTTTVRASLGALAGSAAITVSAAALSTIAVTPIGPTLARGTAAQLAATGTYSDGSTHDLTTIVTWASSEGAVASVANGGQRGLASAIGKGAATITASLGAQSGTTTLTVSEATLMSLTVAPMAATIARGTTQRFAASGLFSDGSTQDVTALVTWTSDDGQVVQVANGGPRGLATGLGKGQAVVAATLGGRRGQAQLTVSDATLMSIALTPGNSSIAARATQAMTATGTFSDGSTQDLTAQVGWRSGNVQVATVQSGGPGTGLATGVAAGTTTVSASLGSVTGQTPLKVN